MGLASGKNRGLLRNGDGAVTGLLASVSSLAEARLVHARGVDVIDLKDPSRGALGAVDAAVARAVAAELGGEVLLSATAGDLPPAAAELQAVVAGLCAAGVHIVKVGAFDEDLPVAALRSLADATAGAVRLVLVFFAESYRPGVDFAELKAVGLAGVMLDTRDKDGASLVEKLPASALAEFVSRAKEAGLLAGLAGSLGPADVPSLLRLGPDYLGFRGALCRRRNRTAAVDGARVAALRRLIPRPTALSERASP